LKAVLRWLRQVALWTGPALVLLLAVAGGFLTWVLTSEQGARWLLVTAAHQFDGEARDVHGSIQQGLRVGSLRLRLPDLSVQARDAELVVDWDALWERRLHVRKFSAGTLALDVQANTAPAQPSNPADSAIGSTLPLALTLADVALGSLEVRVNGEDFFLHVDDVALSARLGRDDAQVVLDKLALGRAQARAAGTPLPLRVDGAQLHGKFTVAQGAVVVERLALAHDLAEFAVQGEGAWTLDGSSLQSADASLRLLDLRADRALLPVEVNALALHAHVARGQGTLRLETLRLAHAQGLVELHADAAWQGDALNGSLTGMALNATVLQGSSWNGQPLTATLHAQARHAAAHAPSLSLRDVAQDWLLPKVALDVNLGENHIALNGALGSAGNRLRLDVVLPQLAEVWPQAAGSLHVQGELGGASAQHQASIEARFTPAEGQLHALGQDPVRIALAGTGVWERPGASDQTWRARLTQLQMEHAGLQARALAPFTFVWQPQSGDGLPWSVGAAPLQLSLNQTPLFTLDHRQSRFGAAGWDTRGGIAQLHVTDARIAQLRQALAFDLPALPASHGVNRSAATVGNDIVLSTDWNLRFGDTLEGEWNLRRASGDLAIPWEPPVPVDLRDLTLQAKAVPTAPGRSQIRATAVINTDAMGSFRLQAQTQLRGDWTLDSPGATEIELHSDMADLGWLNLLNNNLPVELGGAITANLKVQHRPDGMWATQGQVTGKNLRIVYPDEGVRLLDGTLVARFDDQRFVLESLRFPARLRVEPRERRTREWVTGSPDAQGGSLTVSGDWHLRENVGRVDLTLYRYPLLQRSDRHAMVSGAVQVNATLDESRIRITGDLTADAGWVDLDIVSGVPALDGDVVVHRAGAVAKPAATTQVALDMSIDLGSRFYLTGYGLDSGLTGKLRVRTQDGRLRADGALATRGGTISAYGQQLRLFRGSLTFQGDVASPVLDIVAMRSGDLAVRAGVRVAGTARRPRIDLISTPDVNDVEKLSWLLLGRGPDNAGGDAALLLSVGSSFFTSGEPFYRQFGLDELSMRTGALGATGSLLPVESVVRSLDAGVSDIERQFIVASKNITQDLTVSVEQSLSDTGTVGRISYRLARGLNASLSAGTVNGLALVYRWFSRPQEQTNP